MNEIDEARIAVGCKSSGNINVKIYDILGDLVIEKKEFPAEAGVNNFIWDFKNSDEETVSTGVYWLFFEGNGIKEKIKIYVYR